MSMKLKKSTVEDVKARFELLKKKKQEEKKEYSLAERLKDAKEEQERMQSYTKDVSFIWAKMGRVVLVVVVSIQPHAEFGPKTLGNTHPTF